MPQVARIKPHDPQRWLDLAFTLMVMVLLLASSGQTTATAAPLAQETPLVLAFYYNWYDLNTWQSGTVPDTPQEPYESRDSVAMVRQVEQASGAGIDAFVVSWYGPQTTNNQTETNLRQLLDIAATKSFYVAADFETQGPFFPDKASTVDALRYLLDNHANHSAYLRYQGKPVIFFWRQQRFTAAEWQDIRAQVDPDHNSIWIAEGTDIAYQDVFDGHHLYSIAWSPDVRHTLSDWAYRIRRYEDQHQTDRLWVATVMPGYDDTRTTRADAFSVDRRQGDYYQETWTAARESNPDWIIITSFNEWVEGTAIEPSASSGDLYLNLTLKESTIFKSEAEPEAIEPIAATPAEASSTTQSPEDSDSPRITARETVRIRSGPGTSYARLARLTRGTQAVVVGRNEAGDWWQIRVEPSVSADGLGWVTAEYTTLSGDTNAVPEVVPDAKETPDVAVASPAVIETGTVPSPTPTHRPATKQPASATPRVPTPATDVIPPPTPTWMGSILATLTPSATPPHNTPVAAARATKPIPAKEETVELHASAMAAPTLATEPTSVVRTEVLVKHKEPTALLWLGIGAVTIALTIGAKLGYRRRPEHRSQGQR